MKCHREGEMHGGVKLKFKELIVHLNLTYRQIRTTTAHRQLIYLVIGDLIKSTYSPKQKNKDMISPQPHSGEKGRACV